MMNTQAVTRSDKPITGRDGLVAGTEAQGDAWTVDDVVRTIRNGGHTPHHARRWAAALAALVIAAAATASVGVSSDRAAGSPKPTALPARIAAAAAAGPTTSRAGAALVPAPLPARVSAATGRAPVSRSRSFVIVMPADRDYVAATSIPVAGIALGRPHSPRIRVVHVELYVGGSLVGGTDLDVYSGRFAGVVDLQEPIVHADAEIRLSNAATPSQAAVIRSIRLDALATTR
jgi:hypothetical protein